MNITTFALFLFFCLSISSKGATSLMMVDGQEYNRGTGFYAISQWFGREHLKNTLNIYFQNDSEYYPEILISAPLGQELRAQLYTGVVNYDVYSENPLPSMVLFIGTNIYMPTEGMFNVLEIEWAPNGRPLKAAVDWLITTNGSFPSYGSLRYNSDIPVSPVPEPSIPLLGLLSLGFIVRRKR